MQVLLEEKSFEGCGGFTIEDRHRWIIAAEASRMISGDISDYYPHLDSILVYPKKYVATVQEEYEGGIMSTGEEVRSGESWEGGALVLSWEEIRQTGMRREAGREFYHNLIYHEFAHQIDQELGITHRTEAFLISGEGTGYPWIESFAAHFEAFVSAVDRNRPFPAPLDPYGAEQPAEFFAVLTEAFFGIPDALKKSSPELYNLMKELYTADPTGANS